MVADGLVKIMLLAPAEPSVKEPVANVVPVRVVFPVIDTLFAIVVNGELYVIPVIRLVIALICDCAIPVKSLIKLNVDAVMVLIVPEKVKLSVPIPFVTATPPFTVTNPENVVDNAVDVATPTRDKKFCVPYKKVINELVAKNTGLYIIPLKYSVEIHHLSNW